MLPWPPHLAGPLQDFPGPSEQRGKSRGQAWAGWETLESLRPPWSLRQEKSPLVVSQDLCFWLVMGPWTLFPSGQKCAAVKKAPRRSSHPRSAQERQDPWAAWCDILKCTRTKSLPYFSPTIKRGFPFPSSVSLFLSPFEKSSFSLLSSSSS